METEKLICGDCGGITTSHKGKRGSSFVEFFLWTTLVIPGIFYSMWRRKKPKSTCDYCGSPFLLPADSIHTQELLKSMKNSHLNK